MPLVGAIADRAGLATALRVAVACFPLLALGLTAVLAQELWYERRALASGVIVGFAFGLGGLLVPLVGAIADRAGLATALRVAVACFPLLALGLTAVLALLLRPGGGLTERRTRSAPSP